MIQFTSDVVKRSLKLDGTSVRLFMRRLALHIVCTGPTTHAADLHGPTQPLQSLLSVVYTTSASILRVSIITWVVGGPEDAETVQHISMTAWR